MASRHVDVLALHGLWIGLALIAGFSAPKVILGLRRFASGVMFSLAGVLFGAQGILLLSSPERYVGRYVVPPPIRRIELENRAEVFLLAIVALFLCAMLLYLGGTWMWLSSGPH